MIKLFPDKRKKVLGEVSSLLIELQRASPSSAGLALFCFGERKPGWNPVPYNFCSLLTLVPDGPTLADQKGARIELRRHRRFPVHFHTEFSGSKLSESIGTVVNLSEGGCRMETDSQVYTGIQLALRFHVPGEESPIRIERAAVRWNRGREIGVGFITMTPPHQGRLRQLLARLKRDHKA